MQIIIIINKPRIIDYRPEKCHQIVEIFVRECANVNRQIICDASTPYPYYFSFEQHHPS